jgi:hypothetical protein
VKSVVQILQEAATPLLLLTHQVSALTESCSNIPTCGHPQCVEDALVAANELDGAVVNTGRSLKELLDILRMAARSDASCDVLPEVLRFEQTLEDLRQRHQRAHAVLQRTQSAYLQGMN